jgi:hypothetical protein
MLDISTFLRPRLLEKEQDEDEIRFHGGFVCPHIIIYHSSSLFATFHFGPFTSDLYQKILDRWSCNHQIEWVRRTMFKENAQREWRFLGTFPGYSMSLEESNITINSYPTRQLLSSSSSSSSSHCRNANIIQAT